MKIKRWVQLAQSSTHCLSFFFNLLAVHQPKTNHLKFHVQSRRPQKSLSNKINKLQLSVMPHNKIQSKESGLKYWRQYELPRFRGRS